jgi:hypothetical protein
LHAMFVEEWTRKVVEIGTAAGTGFAVINEI